MIVRPGLLKTPDGKGSAGAAPPSLLLDLVPGGIAGYSLRKLRNAYAGNAVNIRRSSDNATQDIGFAGNDFDVAGFNAFIGAGTGFVTKWYDQVGSQDAVQATTTLQPTIATGATSSGRAALFSTGATGQILVGTLTVPETTPLTLGAVVNNGAGGNYMLFFNLQGGTAGNTAPGLFYNSGNGLGAGDQYQDWVTLPGPYTAAFHSAVGVIAPGANAAALYVDGVSATGTVNANSGGAIVYLMNDAGNLPLLNGYLAEAIYWGGALSAGSIVTVRSSHQSYYGTP